MVKLNCNSFFDGKFKEINLNSLYLHNTDSIKDSKNPKQIQSVLDDLHFNLNFTYGGYGENRKDIWNGTYLDENKNYIHLGIDINVPAGTPIKCPFDCSVIDTFIDKDTDIGWGGRIILGKYYNIFGRLCLKCPLLVLGHINPDNMAFIGPISKDVVLGYVGTWPTNGNVFEHLHVQCINNPFEDFDGYGFKKDLKNNPNPFEVEF